jgi:Protein of unknown function DUF262
MEQLVDKINFERKPIKWLYDQLKSELLFVDDSFQRKFVWTEKNQVQLIETILTGYPIPEIYVWENETDPRTGETKHSVIDGQQRLMAIFNYLNDVFALKLSYIEVKDASYKNSKFSQLSDEQKSDFWKYPFAVRIVKNSISREEIVRMFLRLNKTNANLNPQELRNAEFEGLFLELSQELANNIFWERHQLFNKLGIRRMLDIQFVSNILVFFRFGFDEEISQASINRAYDTFNVEYKEYESDKKLFETLLDLADKMFEKYPNSINLFKRTTHLYTLFTTLYYYYRKYSGIPEPNLERYANLSMNYENEEQFMTVFGVEKIHLLREYKALALEGTQKKSNRQRRFEIVRSLTETQ